MATSLFHCPLLCSINGCIFRSGRISSVYIVGGWVVVVGWSHFSKLVNFECVGMLKCVGVLECVRVLEC